MVGVHACDGGLFIGGRTRIASEVSRQFGNFAFGSRLLRDILGDGLTGFGNRVVRVDP